MKFMGRLRVPGRFLAACLGCVLGGTCAIAQVRLSGRVTSETNAPVPGANVTVRRTGDNTVYRGISDPTGAFAITVPEPGTYSVRVNREGFYIHTETSVALPGPDVHVALQTIHEIQTTVNVTDENVGSVDMDRTTPQTTLSSRTLFDVPFPNQNNLRSGLRMIPGVVQDSRGAMHLFGGAEEQSQYNFEGFQLNDPLTGRFDARMSLEAVKSVDVTAGRPSAEYGRGAAGTMTIHARTGGDQFKYDATNVFPGFDTGRGIRVGSWTPRGSVSGPWLKGRAWFFNTTELQFTNTTVPELPPGQDRAQSWRASDLLHNQINLTASNIVTIGLLFNYWYAPRNGLTFLDPRETTVDRRSRQWFGYVKDQQFFRRGALVEWGFASSRTFSRETPQGDSPYLITPYGRRGNSFANAVRDASRDQLVVNSFLPSLNWFGGHQLKIGGDLLRLSYSQNIHRSGIEWVDLSGALLRQVKFYGLGHLKQTNHENSLYVQDSWRVKPGLLFDLGLRTERDALLGNWNVSPRFGFAWSPRGMETTRFSGGVAQIFDVANLRLFTRPLDQFSVSTYYDQAGDVILGPALSVYQMPRRLPNPRSLNWNLSWEQQLPKRLQAKVQYLNRRGSDGFTYLNSLTQPTELQGVIGTPGWNGAALYDAVYLLSSRRNDEYDSVEFSVRQPLRGQHEWMVSYMRSRSHSNAVVERSIDEPLQVTANSGPLPWDAPNRLLSWGYLPTWWKSWSIAYLWEWRTGFPFSVQDQYGHVVGAIDDHRFPQFFELNLFVEHTMSMRGYRFAVRGGFNNITGHQNPNVVNNIVGGPLYLKVYGGQSRAMNFRIRLLGKQ